MGIFDKQGNPIGDGRHHVKEHVYEFNEYPQISAKVTKSLTTETTYVKYYNSENGKSITVRFSNHVSNAVLFGDQLNGYTAKRDEILFYLGLKKRTLIPNTRLHIWTQSVAKKKLNDYEYTDKTIGDLYELGEGADISKHKGKIAKGSNYLILGDSVEKVIDKKINSLGQKVVLGEYVYSDISVSDEKFKRGGEITPDVCVNYIKKTESILRNGYYSDHGLFYLITYNSSGGKGINVYQTVNYALVDKLAFFLGFSDTTVSVTLLKHYEEARRFNSLKILKEIKDKPVIIVDRDTIVCSDYDKKKAKYKMKKNDCIEYVKNNESILKNGYYHEFDGIILLTYNSGGKDNLPVHQTVNMRLADKLSELLKIDQYSAFRIMENHSEKAKRFHDIEDAYEFYGKEVIIADRDRIVCHDIKEFKEGGEVNKEDKVARFEKGKKLSDSEKREVYATMRDSYKELKRPYTFEDTERGEKKVWLEDSSEYMVKSGITSRMIRWFITLPDGTIAHPTELFPNVTVSEMNSTEKNIEYNERQSELRYNKVVDALKKSGEIGKVVSRIKTAMQNGAEFIDVYDSADIGKKNPFTRLKFRNGSSWSVPQYTISADDSYLGLTDSDLSELRNTGRGKGFLHHELAEIDWKRFLNEFELGGEVNKETESNDDVKKILEDVKSGKIDPNDGAKKIAIAKTSKWLSYVKPKRRNFKKIKAKSIGTDNEIYFVKIGNSRIDPTIIKGEAIDGIPVSELDNPNIIIQRLSDLYDDLEISRNDFDDIEINKINDAILFLESMLSSDQMAEYMNKSQIKNSELLKSWSKMLSSADKKMGAKAEKRDIYAIAKEQNTSPLYVSDQFKIGTEIEMKNFGNNAIAKEIALDNLLQSVDYYKNKETKMDKPKNNVALYTRVKGEKQFKASDFKGNQVDRLVNAPLVSPDKFDEFLKAVKDTAEQNKGVDFRIKEFGTNKIWYDSQLSKGTEVESNKHEELPYGEIIIVEHSLKSGANVRDAYITVRKDSPFVIQFKNRHVYCLKFRKINNEEWTFYNVAVGFTKKEFDELKEGSIKHTMENTMKFVSTEKRIIEKLLIYELDYLSEKGYMLAPLFIDTYGTTYSVEKLDDDGYYFVNESFTKRGKQLENNNPISYYADTATTVFEAIDKKYKKAKEDELSKGTKVELEHKDTIEEISSGKLSPEEGAKEIAKDHIDEDPQYYDKLEKVESKTPIKELGTGSKVYFETPFYRVNEYSGSNLNDRFIFTMKAKDDQYGVPLFEHFFADIDIALFVAEKISKIYPNGVPEAALIHRIIKDISGEYKEKQENNMSSTNNELTGVKSIIVNESRPFSNWDEANESTKWLISQQAWSNLPYKIEFQDGFILEGTIDAEPYSFWKDKKNPLTWHLNTFWGNLARATANPIYDQESIDYAKKVVTKYNIGQDISTDVDNSDVTPPESEDAEVVSSAKQDVIKKLLKEKKTAYNFVYDRLLKVAPDLLRLLNEAEYTSDVYGKSQYRTQDFGGNDAFMYLAIEGLDKDEQGRYELSISHYYKQHGDMMCDPCMTVRLDPELKTVEALTFKMDGVIGRGIIKSVYGTTKDGKPGINLYEKKDQNSFLNKWSSNWVKQGHKVEFRSLPEKESTTISAEAQAIIQPEWDKMQDFLAGKEAKASDRMDENEIKREKYPIVVQWSEGSSDENIGFENLEQLEIWLDQIGFTENPDETYIKNKVWFRGMTSYVRIDLSRKEGDFNPQEKSLIEYLIENVSESFDWQALSEAKTPIVQDANFTYFKGIAANYENQFKLNKAIEEFLDSRPDDYVYSNEEKEFIITYEGYGGLEKQGATGIGLLFEYYTPLKLIEKMWGLAYKYGFNTGKVLEPSVGVGRFLNYTGKTDVVKGYEINPYSAKICRIIHPKANIILSSFAEHFYKGNVFNPKFEKDFDLVIGNPPYGKMTDLRTHGENSRIGVSISQYEHYFILRGLDCLKSGGLLIYVSTANLATKGYEKIKEKIFEKADLVDCYLLPNTTFKQTKVNTSLIVLRRK